jgi:hypothetical protein
MILERKRRIDLLFPSLQAACQAEDEFVAERPQLIAGERGVCAFPAINDDGSLLVLDSLRRLSLKPGHRHELRPKKAGMEEVLGVADIHQMEGPRSGALHEVLEFFR